MAELKLGDIRCCGRISKAATEEICSAFGIVPLNGALWNIEENGEIIASFLYCYGEFINMDDKIRVCKFCKYDNKFQDYVIECQYCGVKLNCYLDGHVEDGKFTYKIMDYVPPTIEPLY